MSAGRATKKARHVLVGSAAFLAFPPVQFSLRGLGWHPTKQQQKISS
jgi:hypothetical protein